MVEEKHGPWTVVEKKIKQYVETTGDSVLGITLGKAKLVKARQSQAKIDC